MLNQKAFAAVDSQNTRWVQSDRSFRLVQVPVVESQADYEIKARF